MITNYSMNGLLQVTTALQESNFTARQPRRGPPRYRLHLI